MYVVKCEMLIQDGRTETGSCRMFSKKLNVYVIKSEMLIQDGDRQL